MSGGNKEAKSLKLVILTILLGGSSMPRASEVKEEVTLKMRHDGAIICNEKMPRGRCNKFVADKNGEVKCPNGHMISARDIANEAFKNFLAEGRCDTYHIFPSDEEIKLLIDYFVRPEILEDNRSVFHMMITFAPETISQIIGSAETMRPDAAKIFKQYWENKVAYDSHPLLGKYLDLLKYDSKARYLIGREKILRSYASWGLQDPMHFLAWSETMLEAAEALNDPKTALYKNNVYEAGRWIIEWNAIPPIYFVGNGTGANSTSLVFTIMIDPRWQNDEIRKNFYGPHQVGFQFEFHQNYDDIKWFSTANDESPIAKKISDHMGECFGKNYNQKKDLNFIETSRHINAICSSNMKDRMTKLTKEEYAFEIMKEIRSIIGNCGFRS